MTVCYFGYYKKNYSRNRNLIKALRLQDVEVLECQSSLPFSKFRYLSLLKQFLSHGRKAKIIIVGFPGHTDVPLAFILAKMFGQKLIFDPFLSLYNTVVDDRKYASANSWPAHYYFLLDKFSCLLADIILMDTSCQIKYFMDTFKLPKNKFRRLPVAADESVFKPKRNVSSPKQKTITVCFHGNYLPLQGVEYIIKAASILKKENFIFYLLGSGIGRGNCEALVGSLKLKNVKFLDSVPYEKLPQFIAKSDIYLGGPFKNNLKANLVIPNKVVEAIAMHQPVIVGKTPAMKEFFRHKVNCYMVNLSDENSIASALMELKENKHLRQKLADNGFDLFKKQFSLDMIGKNLLSVINSSI